MQCVTPALSHLAQGFAFCGLAAPVNLANFSLVRVRQPVSPISYPSHLTFRTWVPAAAMVASLMTACSPVAPTQPSAVTAPQKVAVFPDFIADPNESLNRKLWAFNEGLLLGIMQPTSRAYRTVVPLPARRSIKDFTRNITYPGRLLNHLLQGRWNGAGDESLRFLANTTVGVGGLFDVASRWKIPKSDADFGQTFGSWGWQPKTYLMLPLLGPSDDRHALGLALDELAEPWNYEFPYVLASYGTTYDRLSDKTETAAQFTRSQADPYVGVKYAWTYATKDQAPEWLSRGQKDLTTLQTLGAALIQCQDPKFIEREREMSVSLPSTGREMKFSCWLQPTPAPLVYVAPGLGSHRLSAPSLSLAESLYQKGYSVVTTTGVFHPEFMERASTADLPGYPPTDCHDLLVELTAIDQMLEKKYPSRFGQRAFVGFSMGGFQALYLAAHEKRQEPGLIHFDRYVAINPPVDLNCGDAALDRYYAAPLAWPIGERQQRINNAVHKVAKLGGMATVSAAEPPFDAIESEFLVGLSFRLTLRDTIYSSQMRHNRGVLQVPLSRWRREASYHEIFNFSFQDYFEQFVAPYYRSRGIGRQDFEREMNLKIYQNTLRAQTKVRAVINRNDFLLSAADTAWLKATLGQSRLKIFAEGGHLGNLASAPVQDAIHQSLSGLK